MVEVPRSRGRRQGSLVVVGTGYQVAARITPEAATRIANADTVLYLVYDWLDEVWLRQLKPNAISLADSFKVGQPSGECCRLMAQTIMQAVRKGKAVCAAFSGHPSICVDPTRAAFSRARSEGFPARMIPGISVLDCLFADLCLDPTTVSCRVFDATRFLLQKRVFDHSSGLVLLQISQIGRPPHMMRDVPERAGLKVLQDKLVRWYGPHHEVVHYQTALSPFSSSIVEEIAISRLHRCEIKFKSTLYVPPRLSGTLKA